MEELNKISDRLLFLGNEFKIFEESEIDEIINSNNENHKEHNDIQFIKSISTNKVLAIRKSFINNNEKGRYKVLVYVSCDVFGDMVKSDPTDNKEYLQWMLTVFRNLIKDSNISNEKARQFAEEDLNMANNYLTIFSRNKHKRRFKELCTNSFTAPKTDPTNINQYSSLSQLFDAVYPFVEREPSLLENKMIEFENKGQAKIAFRDRKWTVFIPYTMEANCVMEHFASWCTAKPGNSNFNNYTNNYLLPNGKQSRIYVIVNNLLFEGKSKECYQIHFETKQIKSRINDRDINFYEPVLSTSDAISEYFKLELSKLASLCENKTNNIYSDFLIKFGFCDALFDMLDSNRMIINFENKGNDLFADRILIPKLPDISKFKNNLDELVLVNVDLAHISPSIGELKQLQLLSLQNNKLVTIPKEIGKLKKLELLNIKGNKIESIPDEIGDLDFSNGGSLYRVSIDETDLSKENFNKLRKLLPNAVISGI